MVGLSILVGLFFCLSLCFHCRSDIRKGNLFSGFCSGFQFFHRRGVVQYTVNHVVVLLGGHLRRLDMTFLLGGDSKGPCAVCHNEIPAVLRLVVESIPGGLHLFPAHGGYIESPPRRFNGFARFQFVGGKRLSLLLEKFRHLPITDAIHIVGSLFPVLPEYHNIPQRERERPV